MDSTATDPEARVPNWRGAVVTASACAILGLVIRAASFAGAALPPPAAMIGLGVGLVGASMLLAWAADAAEVELSGGLVLAGLTLVTILPELVVELHFAYTLQTELVSANLTGATRLLLTAAVAMPLVGAWLLARRGRRASSASYRLAPARRVDLAILFIASLYGILLALLGRVSVIDGLLLIALYLFFLRRIGGTPGEPPAVVGVSAGLAALPRRQRHRWLVGLFALAAFVLAAVAVPFTDALQATGTELGISSFLLVQSIVPAATETPEFVVALALALNRRPGQGLAVFLAASVIQWTLALGLLPLTYLAGGGGPELPLDTRATVEVALTVATTLMAVAALASLRPKRIDSAIVLTLFAIQFAFPSTGVRVVVAVVLAMFALDILVANRRSVRPLFASLRSRQRPRVTAPS
jgi:cation:H+ antiporter